MKLADIFSNYFTVRKELLKAVEGLSQQQLDWSPPNHPASIGRLLSHIAEAEYFWIDVVATKRITVPEYEQFKQAHRLDEILLLLDQMNESFTKYLVAEDTNDWDEVFYEIKDQDGGLEKLSKRWVVWHVVEHQARHRGQIFMLMRMQGIEVPHV